MNNLPDEIIYNASMIGVTQQEILKLIDEQPEKWRNAIVSQRRLISRYIADLGIALAEWGPSPEKKSAYDMLRQRFSRLRSSMAEHQSRWPAVSADPDNIEFTDSNQNLKILYVEFAQSLSQINM